MARTRKQKLEALAEEICGCPQCPLCKSRTHAVPGDGKASVQAMLIGEAPGEEEDESGHPFVGAAGRYLDHVLEEVGLDRKNFFITNVVKCRPPENRKPRKGEVEVCTSNYLSEQIELVDPKVIMLLGSTAATHLLGLKSIKAARDRIVEAEGRRYLVTYHPASRFYRKDLGEKIKADFARLKEELEKG